MHGGCGPSHIKTCCPYILQERDWSCQSLLPLMNAASKRLISTNLYRPKGTQLGSQALKPQQRGSRWVRTGQLTLWRLGFPEASDCAQSIALPDISNLSSTMPLYHMIVTFSILEDLEEELPESE